MRRFIPVNNDIDIDRTKVIGWKLHRNEDGYTNISLFLDYPTDHGITTMFIAYDDWTAEFIGHMRSAIVHTD